MSEEEEESRPAGISNEAVKARTGRTWPEWFALLDEADGVTLGHKGIVALLAEHRRVGPWWRQMITVAYEQERGLRDKYQTPEGYQISASRTIGADMAAVFAAWSDDKGRAGWLTAKALTVRRATPGKSLRITWGENGSTVDVNLYARGNNKTQVVVDHRRLAGAEAVREMKAFWTAALDRLKEKLEA